jgi:hypothetical protein
MLIPETLHMPQTVQMHARVDQKMCDIVNLGIAVQAAFSTLCALEYLKSYNIDPDLIERVLLHRSNAASAALSGGCPGRRLLGQACMAATVLPWQDRALSNCSLWLSYAQMMG